MERNIVCNRNKGETWAFLSGFACASLLGIFTSRGYTTYFHNVIFGFFNKWKTYYYQYNTIKRFTSSRTSTNNKEGTLSKDDGFSEETDDGVITMDSPTLSNRILRKAETVIQGRTSRLLVVVERCTNDHNYSAILRTVEALGIQHVWVIAPPPWTVVRSDIDEWRTVDERLELLQEEPSSSSSMTNSLLVESSCNNNQFKKPQLKSSVGNNVKRATECDIKQRRQHHLFAQRAVEWLTLREFDTTEQCVQALLDDRRTIWATDLSQCADCMTREGLMANTTTTTTSGNEIIPERLAIVFGTEAVGCTQTMLQAAHRRVHLPMRGFADSLNLSVAAALCILQLFHLCPEMVGQMPEEERQQLRRLWFPKLATQRILTTGMRKRRARMVYQLQRIEELEQKLASGERLEIAQHNKLQGAAELRKQLQQLEDGILQKAETAVHRWIQDPPKPLSDMRRADMHRVCYVGVSTKKKNQDIWKGMPAVSNVPGIEKGTVKEFRELFAT